MMNRIHITIVVLLIAFGAVPLMAMEGEENYIYYRSGKMMEGDGMLTVEFTADIVGQAVSRLEAIRVTPKLITTTNSIELPGLLVVGSNKRKVLNRWSKISNRGGGEMFEVPVDIVYAKPKGEQSLNYRAQTHYQEWMDSARMVLYIENIKAANQSYTFIVALSDMVKLAAYEPYKVDFAVNYIVPDAEPKKHKKEGRAFIDFPVGRSEIIPSYRRNPEELREVHGTLSKLSDNPDITVNELFIEGYASPEGSHGINQRLSRDRADAMKQYIVQNFNLSIPPHQISVTSAGEDWDGLRAAVLASSLPARDRVVQIIDNTPDIGQRKARIRLLGGVYNTLLRDFFPQLRRVEYLVNYTIKDYSVAETKPLLEHYDFEMLNQREMFDVAMNYGEGSSEYERILLEDIPRNYPDNMAATINAAAAMINRGEYSTAKRFLQRYANSPEVFNNMGVIALVENRLDEAEQYFNMALRQGVVEAGYNLQEVSKKRESNRVMERYRDR